MKTVFYAFFFTLLSSLPHGLRAQQILPTRSQTSFSKGTRQIAASYGYGQGDLLQNRDVISVRAGYYVANRLSVGIIGSWTKKWIDNIHTPTKFSAGPFVRYQFLERRLSPYVETAYQYGQPSIGAKQGVWFTPGVNFRLFSQVRLEASYSYMFIPVRDPIGQPQLGVTVLLDKHRQGL